MECTLPEWVAQVTTLALVGVAFLCALLVFMLLSHVGRRRHPAMTMGDQHSRTLWESLGLALGIFLVFPVVAVAISSMVRPALCDSVGQWQERPTYPVFDYDAFRHRIDALEQEIRDHPDYRP